MTPTLRTRIGSGDPTVGTFLNLGSTLAAEACALAGFDWLLIDLEHGGGGEETVIGQVLAASTHSVPVIVRVESAERIRTGRILDLGATGVMFPRLDSAAEVAEAVRHLSYPPDGDRGVATYNRACGFGLRMNAIAETNGNITGIVQIESAAALEDVEAIAQVPGVDVVFVGPGDLSYALGCPGQLDAPEFRAALTRVTDAARSAGISAGILARDRATAQRYVDEGFTFLVIESDSTLLAAAARAMAAPLIPATTEQTS